MRYANAWHQMAWHDFTDEQYEDWCELAGKYTFDAEMEEEEADKKAYLEIAKKVDDKH